MVRDLGKSVQRCLSHLIVPKRKGGKFAAPIPSHFQSGQRFVQLKDRVPYWNFSAGDRVILMRGNEEMKNKMGTIDRVDRERNTVYLKENPFNSLRRQGNEYPHQALSPDFKTSGITYIPRAYHVSNFRLRIRDGDQEHTCVRLRRTAPTWDRGLRRYNWIRSGLVPALMKEGDSGWRVIKWNEEPIRPIGDVGPLDTLAKQALELSFIPTLASLSLNSKSRAASTLTSTASTLVAPAPELRLPTLDLTGGFHSRAQRTRRFNEKKTEEVAFGKSTRRTELKVRKRGEIELAL